MANPGITTRRVALRMDALAELISEGRGIHEAGMTLGLTKGETSNAWRNICKSLGRQAA